MMLHGQGLAARLPSGSPAARASGVHAGGAAFVGGAESPATTNQQVTVTGGRTLVEFHADWLSIVLRWARREDMSHDIVRAAVAGCFLGEWDAGVFRHAGHGASHYADLYHGPFGVTLLSGVEEGVEEIRVEVKGQGCEAVGLAEFRALGDWCWTHGLMYHVTRMDLAWDHLPFTVHDAVQAVEAGNVRTKAKSAKEITSRTLFGDAEDNGDGSTCKIGSRSSDRMVRIYDQHGYVRCELQLRKERADWAFRHLLWFQSSSGAEPRPFADAEVEARGLLRDYVDFVDRESDSNMTRREALPWWSTFIEGAAKVRHVIARAARSLERSREWIESKVRPTIAMVMAVASSEGKSMADWCMDVLQNGSRRWSAWQHSLVRSLKPCVRLAGGVG